VIKGLFPVRFVQLFGCVDNVVTIVFGGQLESLSIILLNEFLKALADYSLINQELILSDVRNFKEHSCNHVDTFKKLKIDVHVIGHLAFDLFLLELNRLVRLSADALGKDFSKTRSTLNVYQYVMAILNHAQSECSNTNLCHSSVVKNL
jgi:hypothetical protein